MALAWCEIQTASSRDWTRVTDFIPNNNVRYARSASAYEEKGKTMTRFLLCRLSAEIKVWYLFFLVFEQDMAHKTTWWKWKKTTNVVTSISFQTFFALAFKIVVDSWKFSMLLLYILWDDWPILMISASNQLLQQQLEYTLLKPDCHR